MDDAEVVKQTLLLLFHVLVVLPLFAWGVGRQLLGRKVVERQLRAGGFERAGEGWVVRRFGAPVQARLERREGQVRLRVWGPAVAATAPRFLGPRDDVPTGERAVRSGDARFDRAVLVAHPNGDDALAWLSSEVRRAVGRAVRVGARLEEGCWRFDATTAPEHDVVQIARAIAQASRALEAVPASTAGGLEALLHDEVPGVRVRALEVLDARGQLRDEHVYRLARGPYAEVHLAVIQRGGMWAVDAWNALRRNGGRRQRAAGAVALARGWAEGRVVGRRLDEDVLVEELVEALEDVAQGWEAARLLAGFERPHLGRALVLRFGDDLPPPARRLRQRLVEQGGGRGAVSLVDPVGGALALAEG